MKFILFILFSLTCYSQPSIEIDEVTNHSVSFAFHSPDKKSLTEYGEFTIVIQDKNGNVVKSIKERPEPDDWSVYIEWECQKGTYKILFYDKLRKLLATSKEFEIK